MHHIEHLIEFVLAVPLIITAVIFLLVGKKWGRAAQRKHPR